MKRPQQPTTARGTEVATKPERLPLSPVQIKARYAAGIVEPSDAFSESITVVPTGKPKKARPRAAAGDDDVMSQQATQS